MSKENFKINTGRDYHKHQHGLCAAIASARSLAAQLNEAFVVYFGADNYGYWRRPVNRPSLESKFPTAHEVCIVEADGSLAIL